jgi:hypothetical protein
MGVLAALDEGCAVAPVVQDSRREFVRDSGKA